MRLNLKISKLLFAIAAAAVFLASPARADTSTLSTELGPLVRDIAISPESDFSRRSLTGSTFVRCDFSNAQFCFADLNGARFFECDLSNADFTGANLSGAAFTDCNIERATFNDSFITNIKPADGGAYVRFYLSEKQLKSTKSWAIKDLRGYEFHRESLGDSPSLEDFDLRGGFLVGGDFTDVSFENARIERLKIRGDLSFTQLQSTHEVKEGRFPADFHSRYDINLSDLDLTTANLIFAKDVKIKLDNATLRDCTLQFTGHDAVRSLQASRSFKKRSLKNVVFRNASLDSLMLNGFVLQNVFFSGCDLNQVSFSNAACVSVTISQCKRFDLSQLSDSWNKSVDMMQLIRLQ
ncbi:pentapeptide repeat-containing protein [Novipirellula rosea]|uniref:Secreted effector protein pipB2 n=1 Tax=Novipirellula rosea TaxID=1031540 RepID=A0ABP8M991_9BACT|tara:strand:+ start:11343 stop:12398 length:1056 start_codon:yes stop_codon:yes gene_type:complete